MNSTLVLLQLGRSRLGHTIKTNFIISQTDDSEICSILILYKRMWDYFLHHILHITFQEKCFHVVFYLLTKFHCVVVFTSWDIGKYVFCCPVCDVINFEINLSFLIKSFSYIMKKSGQKSKYLKNKKGVKHGVKSIFHPF